MIERREVGGGLVASFHRAARLADRIDDRFRRRSARALTSGHPGVVPAAWASAKLIGVAVTSPVVGAIVLGSALRSQRWARALTRRYPQLLQRDLTTDTGDRSLGRVGHASAGGAYFISSDLHRCVPGTVDWVSLQQTESLYRAALGFYADRDWALIENGDVEDFWLRGGSTYGVVYDIARLVADTLGGRRGRAVGRAVSVEQLRRIVANNPLVYELIDQRFHRYGRYFRLVGNHDDVYLDPEVAEALGEIHPGLAVHDHLLLVDDPDEAIAGAGSRRDDRTTVGIVAHGHHTDAWNAPHRSGLGRLGTWLGSALLDAPLVDSPGIPDREESGALRDGRAPNLLTTVNRHLGASRELYSLDEVALFHAWRQTWYHDADGSSDRHDRVTSAGHGDPADPRRVGPGSEPWVVFGHTHVPLRAPIDPADGRSWDRYVNSGSGIFHECITGVEWDGRDDPRHPQVLLVSWRYADHDPDTPADAVVAWDGSRAIVREVLERVPPSDRLSVVARGHHRRAVPA